MNEKEVKQCLRDMRLLLEAIKQEQANRPMGTFRQREGGLIGRIRTQIADLTYLRTPSIFDSDPPPAPPEAA